MIKLPQIQRYLIESMSRDATRDPDIIVRERMNLIDSANEELRGESLLDFGALGAAWYDSGLTHGTLVKTAEPKLNSKPLAYIRQFLDSKYNEKTRSGSAYALKRWGGGESLPALINNSYPKEPEQVREEIIGALGNIGGLDSTRRLLEIYKENGPLSPYALGSLCELLTGGSRSWVLGNDPPSIDGLPSDVLNELLPLSEHSIDIKEVFTYLGLISAK